MASPGPNELTYICIFYHFQITSLLKIQFHINNFILYVYIYILNNDNDFHEF